MGEMDFEDDSPTHNLHIFFFSERVHQPRAEQGENSDIRANRVGPGGGGGGVQCPSTLRVSVGRGPGRCKGRGPMVSALAGTAVGLKAIPYQGFFPATVNGFVLSGRLPRAW